MEHHYDNDTITKTLVAHRGLSTSYPENSRLAFEEAFKRGIMAVECDVRLTKDRIPVVIHDDRIDRVSDGRGKVGELTLAELQRFNFGTATEPQHILTLDELLELVDQNPGAHLFLETKHPDTFSFQLERKVIELLRKHSTVKANAVTVISFSVISLAIFRWRLAACPTIFLRRDWYPDWWKTPSVIVGTRCGIGFSKEEYARHPRVGGADSRKRYVFTVNDKEIIESFVHRGIDFVATDIADEYEHRGLNGR